MPAHFVRPNEANRYPRRVVVFDAESRIRETRTGETHSFMLAAASFDELPAGGGDPLKTLRETFDRPADVWAWVDARTRARSRTVVFAHNLAYDLRITNALVELPELGWRLDFLTVDGSRTVARYSRHKPTCTRITAAPSADEPSCSCNQRRSLVLVDLHSFLPTSLERIGDLLGMRKAPLPKQSAGREAWLRRCTVDVEITRAAVLRLLGWLESNDMGSFRLTGAAQGMAAYRHRFMPRYGLLVHRDERVLQLERRAAWTGRCEAYRWGEVKGPLHEWDFSLAYLHLAAESRLPVRLRGEVSPPSLRKIASQLDRRRYLLDVQVDTEQPTLPTERGGRIVWPTGAFTSTVWDIEALHAHERGAEILITGAWAYDAQPVLATWAQWLLAELDPAGLPADSLERLLLKGWARSVVGRFGLRHPVWERVGTVPGSALGLVPFVDADTGETGAHLEVGGEWYERAGLVEAPDSMPAIMGAIMAAARVQLANAVLLAGPENVVYVDTDSLLVTEQAHRAILTPAAPELLPTLRHKASYRRALIRGPRSLELDDELRAAGVPRRSLKRSDGRYEAQLWEGLDATLRRGAASTVKVTRRLISPGTTDTRRRHLADGTTAPWQV